MLELIRDAKGRLLIVSPWISPACADLAVKKQEEGVKTVLVTTNDGSNREALLKLLERRSQKGPPSRWWLLPGVFSLFLGICLLVGVSTSPLLCAVLMGTCVATYLLGRSRRKYYYVSRIERLALYLPKEPLLHAKIYVADERVALGSANFTVSGLKKHFESIAIIDSAEIAADVVRQLDTLEGKVAVFEMPR
ncbi:MAG: phospholipase D-like domain-containing protein [Candidatus Hadarchaeum sp.]